MAPAGVPSPTGVAPIMAMQLVSVIIKPNACIVLLKYIVALSKGSMYGMGTYKKADGCNIAELRSPSAEGVKLDGSFVGGWAGIVDLTGFI